MSKLSYSEKLKDPRWQKLRLLVFQHADFKCQLCGCADLTLHAHHSKYQAGKEPWEYPIGALCCLCEECHEFAHGRQDIAREVHATLRHTLEKMRGGYRPSSSLFPEILDMAQQMQILFDDAI